MWLTEYRLVAKKGEGTFSEVLKAQYIKNGKYVAIKCMKNHFESLDQVRKCKTTMFSGDFEGCTLWISIDKSVHYFQKLKHRKISIKLITRDGYVSLGTVLGSKAFHIFYAPDLLCGDAFR